MRQVFRIRLEPRQLPVTDHAAGEQAHRKQRDHYFDRHVAGHIHADGVCHAAERHRQQLQVRIAPVPSIALEAKNEGQQIDTQRQHPEKRNRGHILRQMIGDRQQHHAGHRRQ